MENILALTWNQRRTLPSLFFNVTLFFSQNMVDQIIAVVGSRPILHSEILQQTQIIASSRKINPTSNPFIFQSIYDQTLTNMINQMAVLEIAEKDTNIIVSDESVEKSRWASKVLPCVGKKGSIQFHCGNVVHRLNAKPLASRCWLKFEYTSGPNILLTDLVIDSYHNGFLSKNSSISSIHFEPCIQLLPL